MAYSRGIPFWLNYQDRITQTTNGSPLVLQDYAEHIDLSGSRSGSGVRGWRRKVSNGVSAGSSYNLDITSIKKFQPAMGSYYGKDRRLPEPPWHQTNINTYAGNWDTLPYTISKPYPSSIYLSNAENAALHKVLARIRDQQTSWQGGVMLGELRETVKMIRNPAKALADGITTYFRHLRSKVAEGTTRSRRPFARQKYITDVARNLWLEYSLGWAPLLSDMEAAFTTVARWQDEANQARSMKRVQGSGRYLAATTYGPVSSSWGNKWNEQTAFQKRFTEHTVKIIAGIERELTFGNESAWRLAEMSGFKMQDFLPTVWELIPWSFVVDYFVNVGEFINSVATNTSHVSWVSQVSRINTADHYVSTHTGEKYLNPYFYDVKFFNVRGMYVVLKRTQLARSIPLSLGTPVVRLGAPFGTWTRTANLLALWTSDSKKIQSYLKR